MDKIKLRGKDLSAIHYTSDKAKSLTIDLASRHFKHFQKQELLDLLRKVKEKPDDYITNELLRGLAREFMTEPGLTPKKEIALLISNGPLRVFGRKGISSNALQQMELAMRLPISLRGALMPDAHQGYGLPIGGVLATRNAVIPYGVGVDIGCRMNLSLFDVRPDYLKRHTYKFKQALKERTSFGTGGELGLAQEHEILERSEFMLTQFLRQLRGKAARQLGSSGSGNHFVEWGLAELEAGNGLGLEKGKYLGLLSHSGSRGLGATVAKHYTNLARNSCLLPRQAQHLAWLDLNSEEGQEYWLSMNLAGDYAKACHDQIHYHLSRYMGIKPVATVANHHNFAWKEGQEDGEEWIVHRKGATPAAMGELGIIPGSMTATGYIVRGKGATEGLNSASHGAGRKFSRKKAKASFTGSELKKILSREGVSLIGGGVDEAPGAYKNLEEVMASQTELVEVIGSFTPKIVRMDKN